MWNTIVLAIVLFVLFDLIFKILLCIRIYYKIDEVAYLWNHRPSGIPSRATSITALINAKLVSAFPAFVIFENVWESV